MSPRVPKECSTMARDGRNIDYGDSGKSKKLGLIPGT